MDAVHGMQRVGCRLTKRRGDIETDAADTDSPSHYTCVSATDAHEVRPIKPFKLPSY